MAVHMEDLAEEAEAEVLEDLGLVHRIIIDQEGQDMSVGLEDELLLSQQEGKVCFLL